MNRFPMSPLASGRVEKETGRGTGTVPWAHCWLFLRHYACERFPSCLGGQWGWTWLRGSEV